jgi:hypothetical protein
LSASSEKFPSAELASVNPTTTPTFPEQIELHRDRMWRRGEELGVASAPGPSGFIEDVG